MEVIDATREAWRGHGKWWLIAGGVAGLGYVWWTRIRHAAPATPDSGGSLTASGGLVAGPVVDDGTGVPGGIPGTPAAGPSGSPGYPDSNLAWVQQAVARLQLPPYNGDAVAIFNALTKALAGEPVTTAEANLVGWAISVLGTPPDGAPTIVIAPTSSQPPPPTTTPPPPQGTPGSDGYTVKSGDTLTAIGARWGTSGQRVYQRNAAAIEAAARAHGKQSSKGGPNNSLGWWIYPGTRLVKP